MPLDAIIMISKLPNSYGRLPPDTALENNAGAADGFNLSESFCCRFAADAASGNISLNRLLQAGPEAPSPLLWYQEGPTQEVRCRALARSPV